jgi:hypothetical protein
VFTLSPLWPILETARCKGVIILARARPASSAWSGRGPQRERASSRFDRLTVWERYAPKRACPSVR